MKYPPKLFASSISKEKKMKDAFICRFFVRPLSYIVASCFATIGISANMASFLGFLCGLTSVGFVLAAFFSGIDIFVLISIILFIVWSILDCVDGNIARTVKSGKYGDFFDAVAGYIFPGLYFAVLGFYASDIYDVVFDSTFSLISLFSTISAVSFLTLLLFNKKFDENSLEYSSKDTQIGKTSFSKRIVSLARKALNEISFGGLMPFLFLFAYFFHFLTFIIFVYSICFIVFSFMGYCFLFYKAFAAQK